MAFGLCEEAEELIAPLMGPAEFFLNTETSLFFILLPFP